VTIIFSVCTVIFVYTPSIRSVWDGIFIPPNVALASIMACRLFRELKLGLLAGPVVEGAISDVVFRDIGSITGRTFELRIVKDAGVGTGREPRVLGDHCRPDVDIELGDGRFRTGG
jgi:hypothetical protein